MSEVTLKYAAFKAMLVLLLSLIFAEVHADNTMRKLTGSNVDIDEIFAAESGCFFHMMCDLILPLDIKQTVEVVHEKEIQYMKDTYIHYFPEDIHGLMTLKNFRDDEFWVQSVQPIVCGDFKNDFPEEFLKNEFFKYFMHVHDVCDDPMSKEVCDSLKEFNVLYNELLGKMIKKGECIMPAYQDPKETMGLDGF